MLREHMMGSKTTSAFRMGRLTIDKDYDKLSKSQPRVGVRIVERVETGIPTCALRAHEPNLASGAAFSSLVRELLNGG
jgi:hypothetical protein